MAREAPGGTAGKKADYTRPTGVDADKVRTVISRIVWGVFVLFALVLAIAALLVALEANGDNSLVDAVYRLADAVDLGVFDLSNPIKEFGGSNADVKTALFNYGIGAVVYLIVGRLLERLIRP